MILNKGRFVLNDLLAFFIFFFIIYIYTPLNSFSDCIFPHFIDIDVQEYHLMAINFLQQKSFFDFGYFGDNLQYGICPEQLKGPVFDLVNDNGPIVLLTRPPVFTLYLYLHYFIFGITPIPLYWSNILVLSGVLLLIYKTLKITLLWKSDWLILFITIVFFFMRNWDLSYLSVDLLTSFWALLLFYQLIKYSKGHRSIFQIFIIGIIYSILLLTKSIFVFVFPIILIVLYIKGKKVLNFKKGAFSFVLGVSILLLPWIYFVNKELSRSSKIMMEAKERFANWTPQLNFSNIDDFMLQSENDQVADLLVRNKIGYFYELYQENNGFIILTNQIVNETLLNFHNELCVDGDLHTEWRLIKDSYYNHDDQERNTLSRILCFYMQNPQMIYPIFINKLLQGVDFLPSFYLVVLGLCVILALEKLLKRELQKFFKFFLIFLVVTNGFFFWFQISEVIILLFIVSIPILIFNKTNNETMLLLTFILNLIFIMLIFNGDERFIEINNPIFYIGIIGLINNMIKKLQFRKSISQK